jgi:twitching motility two-component system response regulator PilG
MHDGIYLSYLGLTELETKVLKSIFTLAPQLKENYTLIPPEQVEHADLILVNSDDSIAVRIWNDLRQDNQLLSSLMLTDSTELVGSVSTIQRPIRVQKLIAALENIIDQTTLDFDDDKSEPSALDILVVDDSFPVRKYMEHKLGELTKSPINISFATSGEEAIHRATRHDYDLIFLDVMMEGVDGYKVCKQIKADNGAYVVMLTSKKSPFDKVRGTMSGCDAYITKPPADERLADELAKSLARRKEQFRQIARAQ